MVVGGRAGIGLLALLISVIACEPSRAERSTPGSGGRVDAGSGVDVPHCKALQDRLCSQFGPGSDECRMAEEQTKSFSPGRCLTMLSRYDETAKSAVRFVEGRKALVSPEQDTSHGPAPSIGAPGAPITMVFFGDFDSPECARGSPIATAIRNLHQDKVRLVFRQFPLSGNPNSHLAAEASLAAHAQGKFWRLYEVMFGNQQAHDRGALERYAEAAELDLAAFDEALDRHEFAADVDADRDLGKNVNVSELPALFVNGKRVSFPFGEAELAEVIADARKP
jgi:protein-disulfide isomerase